MDSDNRKALPTGYKLDGYTLERQIAVGGFGITYLARQLAFGRSVAIKEYLPAELAIRGRDGLSVVPSSERDADNFDHGLARFREEGKTLVTFEHPNIVAAYDFREANRTAYLVMQYVEGKNLLELLRERGALPESRIREILLSLLDGVEQVHALGFIHRDIKPGNIILRPDCTPVLVDFGAARRARGNRGESPTSIVSSGYAPIEQYSADSKQGPWTDIYALGATLYHMVAGAPPPDATGRLDNDPLVPAVEAGADRYSRPFLAAIDRALARNAADRPQSIAQFRAMLGRADGDHAPLRFPRLVGRSSALSTATVNLPRRRALAAFVHAAPARSEADSGAKALSVRPPHALHRPAGHYPLLRFMLINIVAAALGGAAYLRGWIETVVDADATGITIVIAALFLGGLGFSGLKAWAIARELGCIRDHGPCGRSWAARYVRAIAGRGAGSRAIIASTLRANVSSGIAGVRHVAGSLVLLGLIGTVLGFIIALDGNDAAAFENAGANGTGVGLLMGRLSVALYPTLVGAVLNLWLTVNYQVLAREATKFMTELVALGETNERARGLLRDPAAA